MTNAAAFRATVHSLRQVPSRKICQLVLELPIEETARVASIAEHGAWVAIARLQNPRAGAEPLTASEKRDASSDVIGRTVGSIPATGATNPAPHDAGQEGRWSATAPAPPLQPEPAKSYCVAEAMGGPRCKGRCEDPKDCGGIPEAPIKRERRSWDSMTPAQQAAIRCNDPLFRAFVEWRYKRSMTGEESAAEFVREWCGVKSRKRIYLRSAAGEAWRKLDRAFDDWKIAERAGVI